MNRFLLMPAALLLPGSCISVNTAAQTLDAGTVYRTWQLDEHPEAYLKNGFVFMKATQCDQYKDTPVIGSPMTQLGDGSAMKSIPGTEKTVFLQSPWKEEKNHPSSVSTVAFMNSGETAVAEQFNPSGARKIKIRPALPTIKRTDPGSRMKQEILQAPSTGRKIAAGFQTCLVDVPGTVVANILLIPIGIIGTTYQGLYHLCTREGA
ncbi:hypothetical protein [uncultured Akkermansia sp.]|uniref:hypothetical protein n=1 Tax=uncultured Akkermansia sp. TaxID=512294 RepID=UPI00265D5056|nr:hypothetical protein [uncultured Akkermansia sp.]